jgi:hypothetical protein
MTTGFIFGTEFFIWRSFASFASLALASLAVSFTLLGTLGAFACIGITFAFTFTFAFALA